MQNTISNLLWRFAERCGAQAVSFLVSIILARLLAPEDYGTVALVTVFTTILQVFVDSGMGTALIQKKDADDLDFSSVFYFNIAACLVLYAGLFLAAPSIAQFYGDPALTALVRALSLTVVVSGVRNIQQSYVSRHLLFKRFFFSTIGSTLASAVVGIAMAYAGFGVWALVGQSLSNVVTGTIILWATVPWRPRRMFSWQRLKGLLSFGWKLLVSSLLDTGYNNLRSLIIGKLYSSADLAYYNQGDKLPNLVITNINTSIDSVLLPTMANEQDDPARVRSMTRRAIKTSTYVMAPLMMGLAACAEPLVRLMLTEKWLPCVPYLRIFCITYMFWPIHTANLNAIKALGRSDLFLKLEIVKKAVGLVLLLCTMRHGVMAMAYSLLLSSVLSQIINAWPNRKLLRYHYLNQLADILPALLLAYTMGLVVYCVQYLGWGDLPTLCVQIPAGAAMYSLLSVTFRLEEWNYLKNTVLHSVKRK